LFIAGRLQLRCRNYRPYSPESQLGWLPKNQDCQGTPEPLSWTTPAVFNILTKTTKTPQERSNFQDTRNPKPNILFHSSVQFLPHNAGSSVTVTAMARSQTPTRVRHLALLEPYSRVLRWSIPCRAKLASETSRHRHLQIGKSALDRMNLDSITSFQITTCPTARVRDLIGGKDFSD